VNKSEFKLIHAAKVYAKGSGWNTLLLRLVDPFRYVWFQENQLGDETETPIWGGSADEAILAAHKAWKADHFRTLNCGFRYTLPERDEIGTNALFHQMVNSYASMNGVYFDEELGHNCFVQNASDEARELSHRVK
jgi:hypothetical protein